MAQQLPSIWIAEVTARCSNGRKTHSVVGPTSAAAVRKGLGWRAPAGCAVERVEIVRRGPGAGLAGAVGGCVTPAADRAYAALQKAAARIGMANYRSGAYRVRRDSRGRVAQGYSITEAHKAVVDMMPRVCGGKVSPEQAMALLHEHDVMKERLAGARRRRRR